MLRKSPEMDELDQGLFNSCRLDTNGHLVLILRSCKVVRKFENPNISQICRTLTQTFKVRAGQFFFRGRVISKISPILQSGVELFPKISQMLIRGRVISRFQKILSIRAIVFKTFFAVFTLKLQEIA